jgi:hypothetical protein
MQYACIKQKSTHRYFMCIIVVAALITRLVTSKPYTGYNEKHTGTAFNTFVALVLEFVSKDRIEEPGFVPS